MTKKKILILSTNAFSHDGISNVILNYHRRIYNTNIQFDVAVWHLYAEERQENLKNIFTKVHVLPKRKQKLPAYILSLYKILKSEKYDVIHVHGNSGTMTIEMLIALFAGIKKRIAHSHNSTCDNPKLHKFLKLFLGKLTILNFACSNCAGDWIFNEKYLVLNNGIETDIFSFSQNSRNKHRESLNLKEKIVIGHIGHFSYQKNHDFLIRVFKELHEKQPNFHLLLIGDGPLLESIQHKISEYKLLNAVTILKKRNDVNELLSAMDIFVLPSRFEGLPLAGIEAQAAGLPCFVSDKISRELNISDTVTYLPISDNKQWIEHLISCKMIQREKLSKNNVIMLKRNGYDIASNAEILIKTYISIGVVNV